MGDKLLKKLLIIITLLGGTIYADINMRLINQKVEEIKPSRVGMNHQKLSLLVNPFIKIKSKEDKTLKGETKKVTTRTRTFTTMRKSRKTYFRLYATMNRSAKINGRWVTLGNKISGYTLLKIAKDSVVLQKGNKKSVEISLTRKNRKIKLLTK